MRYRKLHLNLLIALDTWLTDKSVTRPAGKLNITQPAMVRTNLRRRTPHRHGYHDPQIGCIHCRYQR
jgi:hypothetical protein